MFWWRTRRFTEMTSWLWTRRKRSQLWRRRVINARKNYRSVSINSLLVLCNELVNGRQSTFGPTWISLVRKSRFLWNKIIESNIKMSSLRCIFLLVVNWILCTVNLHINFAWNGLFPLLDSESDSDSDSCTMQNFSIGLDSNSDPWSKCM